MLLRQRIHFHGPNIVPNFHLNWFCSFSDMHNIRKRHFWLYAIGSSQFWVCACAVSRDAYVWVEFNPICGFCIAMFPIHYVTFMELSQNNNGCFLLTPVLSSSHYWLLKMGFRGKKRRVTPRKKWPPEMNIPPKHVFGCIEREATLLMVRCRCVEGTKKIYLSFFKKSTGGDNFTHTPMPRPFSEIHQF